MTNHAAMALTARTRRRLGAALVAYGVLGLVLLAALVAVANATLSRLSLADPAGGPLADAAVALGDTQEAFGRFQASLRDAERSVDQAATAARDASATAKRLSSAMSLSVLGAQPLLPLSQDFARQSTDLDAMAAQLDALRSSLRANQSDVATIRADLITLRSRLDAMRFEGASAEALRVAVLLLVLWLALPAVAAIAAGVALIRGAAA